MEYRYEAAGELKAVRIEKQAEWFTLSLDGRTYAVRVAEQRPGALLLEVEGMGQQLAVVAASGTQRWVALPGAAEAGPFVLTAPQAGPRRRGSAGSHEALTAQMPGIVRQVLVAVGDAVERGQPLVLLEAMKMEIKLSAPHAGTVRAVAVTAGQAVERGQLLVDLTA